MLKSLSIFLVFSSLVLINCDLYEKNAYSHEAKDKYNGYMENKNHHMKINYLPASDSYPSYSSSDSRGYKSESEASYSYEKMPYQPHSSSSSSSESSSSSYSKSSSSSSSSSSDSSSSSESDSYLESNSYEERRKMIKNNAKPIEYHSKVETIKVIKSLPKYPGSSYEIKNQYLPKELSKEYNGKLRPNYMKSSNEYKASPEQMEKKVRRKDHHKANNVYPRPSESLYDKLRAY